MKLKLAGLILLVLMVAATALAASPPELKPGQWEMTTTMEMPGMKEYTPAPMTNTICLKPEESKNYKPDAQQDPKCKVIDQKYSGNKFTWTVKCDNATMYGEMIYKGNTAYESTMRMEMKEGGKVQKTITHIKARRVGECK